MSAFAQDFPSPRALDVPDGCRAARGYISVEFGLLNQKSFTEFDADQLSAIDLSPDSPWTTSA
jgi:hypothetical protein